MRVLYISYNSALEPLVQSQVLAYVERLRDFGHWFKLLSFEKLEAARAEPARVAAIAARLRSLGMEWLALPYHKRPSLPATLLDALWGVARGWWLNRSWPFDVTHARSYVPALIGLGLRRLTGVGLLFDMRGMMVDEFVEGGLWRAGGLKYRLVKWAERKLLAGADEIVVLTENIRRYLERLPHVRAPITVIPCCVDLERFRPLGKAAGEGQLPPVLIYAGSVGTWYLLGEMLAFYRVAREVIPGLRFLILTSSADHALVWREAAKRGLGPEDLEVRQARFDDIPAELAQASAGISFRKPTFSQRASSPVKVGEYLAAGLPVVANAGVGDVEPLLEDGRVGVVALSFDAVEYRRLAEQLRALMADPQTSGRCRATAEAQLSLELGVRRYQEVYARLEERCLQRAHMGTHAGACA